MLINENRNKNTNIDLAKALVQHVLNKTHHTVAGNHTAETKAQPPSSICIWTGLSSKKDKSVQVFQEDILKTLISQTYCPQISHCEADGFLLKMI